MSVNTCTTTPRHRTLNYDTEKCTVNWYLFFQGQKTSVKSFTDRVVSHVGLGLSVSTLNAPVT